MARVLALLLSLGAIGIASPVWAQSNSAENERVIAANKAARAATATAASLANDRAIARHGQPEPTQTPGYWTPTPTRTPQPADTATPAPATDPPTATPVPCYGQYGWQPVVLDDQGDVEAQYDVDSGKWDVHWTNAAGEDLWAPLDYFCPDSADTPTPTPEATDTPTPRPPAADAPLPSPPPAVSAPAPRPPAAAPAAPQVQLVERTVVVVATATATDAIDAAVTPAPTHTPTPSPTPTETNSPTSTRTPTPTVQPSATVTPWPTSAPIALAAADSSPRGGVTFDPPPWLDPIGRAVGMVLLVLLVLMVQAPVRRGWRALRHGRGGDQSPTGGLPDDADVGLIGGGSL